MREQPPLAPNATRIPREVTIAPNDAVTRDDQADGITPVRRSNRANRLRAPHDLSKLSIGHRAAGRDRPQHIPHLLLERGAAAVDRDAVERSDVPSEIGMHSSCITVGIAASLQGDSGKSRANLREHSRPHDVEVERAEGIIARDHDQRADRRANGVDPERQPALAGTVLTVMLQRTMAVDQILPPDWTGPVRCYCVARHSGARSSEVTN